MSEYTQEQFNALPHWAQVEIIALENELLRKTLRAAGLEIRASEMETLTAETSQLHLKQS